MKIKILEDSKRRFLPAFHSGMLKYQLISWKIMLETASCGETRSPTPGGKALNGDECLGDRYSVHGYYSHSSRMQARWLTDSGMAWGRRRWKMGHVDKTEMTWENAGSLTWEHTWGIKVHAWSNRAMGIENGHNCIRVWERGVWGDWVCLGEGCEWGRWDTGGRIIDTCFICSSFVQL